MAQKKSSKKEKQDEDNKKTQTEQSKNQTNKKATKKKQQKKEANTQKEQVKNEQEQAQEKQPDKQKSQVKEEKKEQEEKIILEREYVIPLRRAILKVPRYRRAKKAVKAIKEFLARHMKVEDRDIRKVKVDIYLNNEVWFRGIKKPPAKIKVKASKNQDGIVKAQLAEIPEKVRWDMQKAKKLQLDEKKLE
ncbi:MAG: 50S ribosomal protein L31e, partial [Candidatus Nanoarchaeia archaeon]